MVLNFNLHETMAKVISVLNYKGGVAKTTTTANLGTALWILGKKVLLIDTDDQCDLGLVMGHNHKNGERSLHDWMLEEGSKPELYKRHEGLMYIPCGSDSRFIFKLNDMYRREEVLAERIDMVKPFFDYIIIDCKPENSLLNTNAMVASDELLVPVDCSGFSIKGLFAIEEEVAKVSKRMNPNLKIGGVLICRYIAGTKASKATEAYFRKNHPELTYKTIIRQNTRINDTPLRNKTLFEMDPLSNGANDYMTFAEELTGLTRPDNWKEKAILAWLEKYPEDKEARECAIKDLKIKLKDHE